MSEEIPRQVNYAHVEDEALISSSGITWPPADIDCDAGPASAPQEGIYSSDDALSNVYFSMPSIPNATQSAPFENSTARYLSLQYPPNAMFTASHIAVSFLTLF